MTFEEWSELEVGDVIEAIKNLGDILCGYRYEILQSLSRTQTSKVYAVKRVYPNNLLMEIDEDKLLSVEQYENYRLYTEFEENPTLKITKASELSREEWAKYLGYKDVEEMDS